MTRILTTAIYWQPCPTSPVRRSIIRWCIVWPRSPSKQILASANGERTPPAVCNKLARDSLLPPCDLWDCHGIPAAARAVRALHVVRRLAGSPDALLHSAGVRGETPGSGASIGLADRGR